MKKIYYLSTCNTCQRIINSLNLPGDVQLQDIKTDSINEKQLDAMQRLAGSYEALFSKRAQLYRKQKLHEKNLQESDYRSLILQHYTFLKRPVMLIDDQIFIGNSKIIVEEASAAFDQ